MLAFFGENGGANAITDTAKELYGKWSSRATGNLLSDPNFIDAASRGDKEQLARIRPLTREDQQAVGSVLLSGSVITAVQEYRSKVLSDPRLTALALKGMSPEERNRKMAEIKTEYKQGYNQQMVRGFSQYFPEAAKQIIPQYMAGIGEVDAQAMNIQNKTMLENSLNSKALSAGTSVQALTGALQATYAEIDTDPNLSEEEKVAKSAALVKLTEDAAAKVVGEKVNELLQSDPEGPASVALRIGIQQENAVKNALALAESYDFDALNALTLEIPALLQALQRYDKENTQEGGLGILDTPAGSGGETLQTKLYGLMQKILDGREMQGRIEINRAAYDAAREFQDTGEYNTSLRDFLDDLVKKYPYLAQDALRTLREQESSVRAATRFEREQRKVEQEDNFLQSMQASNWQGIPEDEAAQKVASGEWGPEQYVKNRGQYGEPKNARSGLATAMKPFVDSLVDGRLNLALQDEEFMAEQRRLYPTEDPSRLEARIENRIRLNVEKGMNQIIDGLMPEINSGKRGLNEIINAPGYLDGLMAKWYEKAEAEAAARDTKKGRSLTPSEQADADSTTAIENIRNASGKDTVMNYPSRFYAEAQNDLKSSGMAKRYRARGIYSQKLLERVREKFIDYLGDVDKYNQNLGNPTELKKEFVNNFRETQRTGTNKPTGLSPSAPSIRDRQKQKKQEQRCFSKCQGCFGSEQGQRHHGNDHA